MFQEESQKPGQSGYVTVNTETKESGLLFHLSLKQYSNHWQTLLRCQFEKDSQTILLGDLKKNLLKLNLKNLHYTPILAKKASYFDFYSYDQNKIYVASSQNQSKLYEVNTVNKKWERFNLHINRIVAFQINILRNLILVADPLILNIIDESTKATKLTYKPPKEQRILKAIFTANNQSVLVLTSNMTIKQLGLHDLAEEFSEQLPLTLSQPEIAISGNNKYVSITGLSHQLILMKGFAQNSPTFSVLGFPFRIKSVKFDLNNNLIILGRDQVIYYYDIEQNKLVVLFNFQSNTVINGFNVSLDNQYLCCVSTFGNIFVYSLKDTLQLWKKNGKPFQEKAVVVGNQSVPEPDIESEGVGVMTEALDFAMYLENVPKQSFDVGQIKEEDFPREALGDPKVGRSFGALKHKLKEDIFFKQNGQEIVDLIVAFDNIAKTDQLSLSYFFLRWIIDSRSTINKLSLALCPEMMSIVEKRFNLNFEDFVIKSITSLFVKYFDEENWIRIVKFLIGCKQYYQMIVLFFLTYLNEILPSVKKCDSVEEFEDALKWDYTKSVDQVIMKATEVLQNPKYKILFRKVEGGQESGEQEEESSQQKIDRLIKENQSIDAEIGDIQSQKKEINH